MAFEQLAFAIGLGFLLGIKHAFDADHIAAVSTIVTKHRGVKASTLIGTAWGFGHTTTLIIAGLVVLGLRVSIPESAAMWMEIAVAVVLVALGLNSLNDSLRKNIHTHLHSHKGGEHFHQHLHSNASPLSHKQPGRLESADKAAKEFQGGPSSEGHKHLHRPFLLGLVHGMAGSAALMLLVLATINSLIEGLAYIAVFGLGSVVGMVAVTAAIGASISVAVKRVDKATKWIIAAAGLASLAFWLLIFYEVVFAGGLLI